jgi:hypothetical protein
MLLLAATGRDVSRRDSYEENGNSIYDGQKEAALQMRQKAGNFSTRQ